MNTKLATSRMRTVQWADIIKEGYKETLVTDGYQPYHTLMKKDGELKVAGCWSHKRRKFAEIVKATRKG